MNELFSDIWDLPERNDDNPYAAYKEKGESCGEELYEYWEKFHVQFPIGLDGYMKSEEIKVLIAEAIKTGKPVEPPTLPDGAIP